MGKSAANNTLMKTLRKQYMNKQYLRKTVKTVEITREAKPYISLYIVKLFDQIYVSKIVLYIFMMRKWSWLFLLLHVE